MLPAGCVLWANPFTLRHSTVHTAGQLQVSVRDLVEPASLGTFTQELTLPVPCHGVRVLRLEPLRY